MKASGDSPETIPCPHCGVTLRRGMVRCRDCGGTIGDDFELSANVALKDDEDCCEVCGSPLDAGDAECPHCASAMLDELLNRPAVDEVMGRQGSRIGNAADRERAPRRQRVPGGDVAETGGRRLVENFAEDGGERGRRSRKGKGKAERPVGKKGARNRRDDRAGGGADVDDDVLRYLEESAEPAKLAVSAPEPEPVATRSGPVSAASEVSAALVQSLSSTDANLRCQAATALGQLGVADSIEALEGLLTDPELRVRRTVAEALIQLGHPKGDSLRAIAERKPAVVPDSARSRVSKPARVRTGPRFNFRFDFSDFNQEKLVKTGGPVVGLLVLLGGVVLWQSGILFGPRLDSSYRPIKPFWSSEAEPVTTAVQPKVPGSNTEEMNF